MKMAKTGLLILTQPLARVRPVIPTVLAEAATVVSDTLYVCFQPALHTQQITNNSVLHPLTLTREFEACLLNIYRSSSSLCQKLDVRLLLTHICSSSAQYRPTPYPLQNSVSLLLCDSDKVKDAWQTSKVPLTKALQSSFTNVESNLDFHFMKLSDGSEPLSTPLADTSTPVLTYPNVILGGTFDRLHEGHKVMLSQSCLLCDNKLTIGITDGERNKKKSLWELMELYEKREEHVMSFVTDIKPSIEVETVKIYDPFGPTITVPDLQCLVVSKETAAGGVAVQQERQKLGFPEMDTVVVDLVDDICRSQDEEEKVSSSSQRKRLLGTLLHPVKSKPSLPHAPYRIGLVGGIASGKSRLCSVLASKGAKVVDCDVLGHKAYVKGTAAHQAILKEFGDDVVGPDGEIDRKKLGPLVFSDKTKLDKLNSIVWPAIRELAEKEIKSAGCDIIVLEAAVLFEAGWDNMVHEVWTTFVSREEAVKRVMARNSLNQDAAEKRINSQMLNEDRIQRSNVAICSQWETDITDKQTDKAWTLLQERIAGAQTKL